MQLDVPSRTALRVAMRRATHQLHDARPLVFEDPFALQLLPAEAQTEVRTNAEDHPVARGMRSWMIARSRFAEDELGRAVLHGVQQFVLLGAGLDTFAWRNPYREHKLVVFEVDHPATQAWKLELTKHAGLPRPQGTHYVPVNFERDSLAQSLLSAGFVPDAPAFFSWLGVVPYLTLCAFRETLAFLGRSATGSGLVFDYSLPADAVPERQPIFLEFLSSRVAQAGEPFQLFLRPEEVRAELAAANWSVERDLDGAAIDNLYFRERSDGLGLRSGAGHPLSAEIQS